VESKEEQHTSKKPAGEKGEHVGVFNTRIFYPATGNGCPEGAGHFLCRGDWGSKNAQWKRRGAWDDGLTCGNPANLTKKRGGLKQPVLEKRKEER